VYRDIHVPITESNRKTASIEIQAKCEGKRRQNLSSSEGKKVEIWRLGQDVSNLFNNTPVQRKYCSQREKDERFFLL